jgi:hypothetical protein
MAVPKGEPAFGDCLHARSAVPGFLTARIEESAEPVLTASLQVVQNILGSDSVRCLQVAFPVRRRRRKLAGPPEISARARSLRSLQGWPPKLASVGSTTARAARGDLSTHGSLRTMDSMRRSVRRVPGFRSEAHCGNNSDSTCIAPGLWRRDRGAVGCGAPGDARGDAGRNRAGHARDDSAHNLHTGTSRRIRDGRHPRSFQSIPEAER